MNIMLTDLGALSLDIQEIPASAATPVDDFAGLLQQQLLPALDGGHQVVDFNGYFPGFPRAEMGPGIVLEVTPEVAWREYLGQQQVGVDVDDGSLTSTLAEVDETAPHLAAQTAPGTFIATAVAGESFPAGGNALPDEAIQPPLNRAASAASAGLDSPGPAAMSAVVAARSGPAQQPVAPESAALTANLAGDNLVPAGQRAESGEHLPQLSPVAPQTPAVAAAARSGGEFVAARNPSPRPLPATADGSAISPPLDAGAIVPGPDARKPFERMISSGIVTAESGAAQQQAAPRDVDGFAAENLRMTDQRDTLKLPQATQKLVAETPLADATSGRTVDLQAQAVANNTQQAPSAAQPLLHGPAVPGPGASTPAAQQAVLPGPLDVMNIGRNADSSEWGNGLGERVSWMINQKQNSATIRLDPPSLGRLDVHVRVADDATTITIQTQHAQTRDLIETAALRLRDYLQESGYQNVNVDVSQRQDQQHTRSQTQHGYAEGGGEFDPDPNLDPGRILRSGFMSGEGLVDTFA